MTKKEIEDLLRDGFEDRAEGNYDLTEISREQAEAGIEAAQQFVEAMGKRLVKNQ